MKNLTAYLVMILFCSMRIVFAQQTSSMTATASATIVEGISVNGGAQRDLSFGTIVAGASSGSVSVTPDGIRSIGKNGGQILMKSTAHEAEFSITASPSSSFTITLPSSAVILSDHSGNTVQVNEFVSAPAGICTTTTTGDATVKVGATLSINGRQPAGNYSGTFAVTFAY